MDNRDKQVINLGLVSLFNDISSEVVMRVLPLYLLAVVHSSFIGIGIVEAISEATSTLGKLFSGYYSDKQAKRKPLVFSGYAMSVVSRPLLLLYPSLALAGLGRFLEKVGKSIRTPPRDAFIADLSIATNRGKNFGINRAMDTFGAVLGLGAVVLFLQFCPMDDASSLKAILGWACLFGVVALGVLGFVVKEPQKERVLNPKPFKISFANLDSDFKYYLVIAFFFALASSSDAFIIVRAREIGMPMKEIFLLLAGFNIVSASTAYSLTKLSDTKGRKSMLILGWAIYAVSYLVFGTPNLPKFYFVLALLFYGLFYALTDGVEKALIADFETGGARGQAYGWLGVVQGLAIIPANLLFAGLYEKLGGQWAFWSSGFLAIVGIILLLFLKRISSPRPESA